MTKIAALLLASTSVFAQSGIAPPQLGFVDDSAHALRPAYGVAGNFILGRSITSPIINEAFSGSVGLLKTDSSLVAFNSQGKLLASMDVPSGPALFAFSRTGTTALVFIALSHAWIEWRGSAFAPLSPDHQDLGADVVLAIAFPNPFEATLIVQRDLDRLWEVHLPLGAAGTLSQNALPGVHAPVLLLPAGDLVYGDDGGIMVRRADASQVRISGSLPANFSLQQMNQEWVELSDPKTNQRFGIRTTPGREGLYRLPE
jgi:hypothetical protein